MNTSDFEKLLGQDDPLDDDHFHDRCGVVGVWLHPDDAQIEDKSGQKRTAIFPAANYAYLGLHALQHRGQESAGIVASDGENLRNYRSMGLVNDIFSKDILKRLPGLHAIGHVRYSTSGDSSIKNAQPFLINYAQGQLAIAHNGNLTNAFGLRKELEAEGHIFQSTMDTEVIMHLTAKSRHTSITKRVAEALSRVEGAFSVVLLSERKLYAARDPYGFRPLALGKLGDHSYIVASESCAFSLVDAEFIREIEPGEMIVVNEEGDIKSYRPFDTFGKVPSAQCIFERIYFARPDTMLDNRSVYDVRMELGRTLAKEHPIEADLVIPVPDSGTIAALGYANESGIPFGMGLIRNHYVGRTFIEPAQQIRQFGVRLKLSPVHSLLKGKRVIVVDDSIVRGTTSAKIVNTIRAAGAKEVHMRISSAPIVSPCYFGIDMPSYDELIAAKNKVDKVKNMINVDSLGYLSIDGMLQAVGDDPKSYCHACFSGKYPIKLSQQERQEEVDFFKKRTGKDIE